MASGPTGDYEYLITFDLSGASPELFNNFKIWGKWSSDNNSKIFLNDELKAGPTATIGSFKTLSDFEITEGFNAGSNELKFVVTNNPTASGSPNPTGLLVAEISAVPEPATVLGSLLGLGMVGYVSFRRRKAAAARS